MRQFGALALFLASCRAASSPPGPDPSTADVVVEVLDPEWERIARDAARGHSLPDQKAAAESDQHYLLALAYYDRGDFERAQVEARKAVRLRPENLAARKLLGEVLQLTGGRPAPAAGDEVRAARVRVDQAKIEVEGHLRDGERYFNAAMYKEAAREFEQAELKIRHMPYEVPALNELLPKVRDSARRAREAAGR